jgi:hypothetical protein
LSNGRRWRAKAVRSAIFAAIVAATAGQSRSKILNSVPKSTSRSTSDAAVTVALRRSPLRIAVSPKKSPGPSVLTTLPSRSTSTVPSSITKNV